jgi:RimJ/RimL family protein N-acetyltransferase
MNVSIRPTTGADLPGVLAVLDDAAAWLHSIGMREQWPRVISEDATWVARLTTFASEGRMYLAFDGDAAVGTFHLRDDPGLGGSPGAWWWPEGALLAQSAVYLFTLAVRRCVAGQGVAGAMLDWAFEAARGRERVLRLDCWAGNEKLRRYYAEAGFQHLGDVAGQASDGRFYEVSRFQRSE